MRADLTDVRGRLAEVGVALGVGCQASDLRGGKGLPRHDRCRRHRADDRGACCGARRVCLCACRRIDVGLPRPQRVRDVHDRRCLIAASTDRHPDDARHRAVAASSRRCTSSRSTRRASFFFGTVWNPQFRRRLRPRHPAAALGHALCLVHRAAGRGADRPAVGDLPVGICQQARPHGRQAADRDPRRHPDHRLRALRPDHRRTDAARLLRPAAGSGHQFFLGHDGRHRHGHHGDPVRLLAVRRHHQRRAAVAARRLARPWRDAVRNDPPRGPARRTCPASSVRSCWPPAAPSARR